MTRRYEAAEDAMQALLDLLACPVTGETGLVLEGTAEEGLLRTPGGRVYPIIAGVPRMLPPDLLAPFLRGAYPEFARRWPALEASLTDAPDPEPAVLETLIGYSFQHVDVADDTALVDDWRATWDRFQPGVRPEDFAGQVVLDVGCGEGRHAWLVAGHARTMVGLDLSRGVEVSRRRDPRPTSFYVQGDLRRPPFRRGAFDALYSNGVLHHTPDPAASFAAVRPLVKPGGRVYVWVYGLDDMRLSYRLSHLTWLRPVTNRMPRRAQVATAAALAAGLEASVWTPTRLLRRAGLDRVADRLPLNESADQDWTYKLRRALDRLTPPITHYLRRDDLERWFAAFDDVEVLNADGRGWSARGRVR
jgi:SAM-dependent methyltransferase/uncharacterized protein YbaR (Trm112 family)